MAYPRYSMGDLQEMTRQQGALRQADRLIILTGLPAAGKTTVAFFLGDLGFSRLDVAVLLQEEMKLHGWPISRPRVGPEFVATFGHERVFELVRDALRDASGPVVVDSVRLASTCLELRETYSHAHIWHVSSTESARQLRLRRRVEMIYESDEARQAAAISSYSAYDAEDTEIRRVANVQLLNIGDVDDLRFAVTRLLCE